MPVPLPEVPDGVTRHPPSGGAGRALPLALFPPRRINCLAFLAVILAPPALAQAKPGARHDIVVTGSRPPAGCAVRDTGLDLPCLNGELRAAAKAGQDGPPVGDGVAAHADTPSKVGTFSYSATQQRLGSNFGKSAMPARAPAPRYTSPSLPVPRPK